MSLQLYRLFHMLSVSSKNKYWVSFYKQIEATFIPEECKQGIIFYNWVQYLIWVVPMVGIFMRSMHVQLNNQDAKDLFAFYGNQEEVGPNRVVPGICQRAY